MELMGKSTINPFVFYTGKIAGYVVWAAQISVVLGLGIISPITSFYVKTIAIVILIIGLIFVVVSLINLGRSTRFGLPNSDTVLKTSGLYKLSRNPMYFGFSLLTISSILYTANIIVILLGIYSIIVYHLIILSEEKFLEHRFGYDYVKYKKNVRRYI